MEARILSDYVKEAPWLVLCALIAVELQWIQLQDSPWWMESTTLHYLGYVAPE